MTGRAIRLVVEREIRESARRKGVWAMIAVTFLASSALMVLPSILSDDATHQVTIVGDDEIGLREALEASQDPELEVSEGTDREAATAAITDGEAEVAVLLTDSPSMLVEDEDSDVVLVVSQIVTDRMAAARLTELGIDPADVRTAFAAAVPQIEPIDVDRESRQASAFGITLVLYILTVVLTSQVAAGVAVEKSNRISEVLLAIVPPRALLFGKVIGVGCVGLVTLLAGVIPVAIRFAVGGDLPSGLGPALAGSAIWFAGGLALYLILAGSLGALVSRQEEAGAVVVPLTMLLVVGYVVALSSAESTVGAVLAYVPFLSPMIEPYRIAVGAGSTVEYVVSAAILLGSVVLTAKIGAVVFRRAIVQTGRRIRWRDLRSSR